MSAVRVAAWIPWPCFLEYSNMLTTRGDSLLVLGDWGRGRSRGQRAVASGLVRAAESLDLNAIVSTGDNFYESGVVDVEDPKWRSSFLDVYSDDRLQVPWIAALGNHDHMGSVRAQIDYSMIEDRWHLPWNYYSKTLLLGGYIVQLIVLDTTPMLSMYRRGGVSAIPGLEACDPRTQRSWLSSTLARSRADWKIVVGHHPVFSASPVHGGAEELQKFLRPVLEEHGVDVYLSGHEHDLQHCRSGSIDYLVSGAGSEFRETGADERTLFAHSGLGFAAITVLDDLLVYRFYDERASLLFESYRPKTSAHRRPRP